MANTLLTISQITRKALVILHNNLAFARNVFRGYDESFARRGAKIGDTLRIRLPNRYTVTSGATLVEQDTTEQNTAITIATRQHVGLNFTDVDLTLSLDDFSERILEPAMAVLASKIDQDGLALYSSIYNSVGTPGTTPSTLRALLLAQQKLDEFATPRDMQRTAVVNPAANAELIDGMKGFFHAQSNIESQFKRGLFGSNIVGLKEISMDQNVNVHTTGTLAGTPLVNGASQTGANLITDGWTASSAVVKKGDIFTLPSVFAVNPENYTSTGALQQFVVTANTSSDGSGEATIPISPSIVTTGALKTVTASPADNAALTFMGAASTGYPQNMIYHRDAFALATADLELPRGTDMAHREVYDGVSICIVRDYRITSGDFPARADVLYGWVAQRPSMACRLWG